MENAVSPIELEPVMGKPAPTGDSTVIIENGQLSNALGNSLATVNF